MYSLAVLGITFTPFCSSATFEPAHALAMCTVRHSQRMRERTRARSPPRIDSDTIRCCTHLSLPFSATSSFMQRPRNPNCPRHSLRLTLLYTLDVNLQPPNYTGTVPETEASVSARLIPQTDQNSPLYVPSVRSDAYKFKHRSLWPSAQHSPPSGCRLSASEPHRHSPRDRNIS
jgi:hypothetical protein